nr:uncharacterized protein LOC110088166 [Pogona vitticeps]XP_020665961.1 uncharacterized protein LOC110088166 [Pogona vitticeps]
MEQMKATAETLRRENRDLLLKLRATEEGLRSVSQEKDNLMILVQELKNERDITNDNMIRLSRTIEKTVAANLELQEHVRATARFSKGCREILQESRRATFDKSTQYRLGPTTDEMKRKLEQLAIELGQQVGEKERLLAENKEKTESLQKAMRKSARLKRIMDNCWNTVMSLRMENDRLRCSLVLITEKEVMNKLSIMEKKKDYIASVTCHLKGERERLKAVVTKGLARVSHSHAAQIRKLQKQYEQASKDLCCLLDDIKYYFFSWFKEYNDYYMSISRNTMDLLEENIKQLKVVVQIQNLKKVDQNGDEFEEMTIPALREKLDVFLEGILEEVSALEEELLAIEAKVQELENSHEERKQYVEKCSASFSMQEFEKGIGSDTETLRHILDTLKPISQALSRARKKVVLRHAFYSKESEVTMKTSREKSKQWLHKLAVLQELRAASPATARELEEAMKLEQNLTAVERVMVAQLDEAAALEKEEPETITLQPAKDDVA